MGPEACLKLGFYFVPDSFCLSVVIPVFNEQNTIESLVDQVTKAPFKKQIIIVDDGSTDRTPEVIEQLVSELGDDTLQQLEIVRHPKNRGKGAAVRSGLAKAIGDIVLIQDADLEYDPTEYPRLIQPIIDDKADVVYGSRFLGDRPHRALYFWHHVGNRFLTGLSNLLNDLNLTDMETCYKVFRREVVEELLPRLKQNRFGVEPEITARIARRKYRVYEVAVSYSGRTYDEGKKIRMRDGLAAIWHICRYGLFD